MAATHATPTIRACPCCGLAQTVPPVPPRMRACCGRCGTRLVKRSVIARSNRRTAALATAALVLYPFGVGLPIMEVRRLGHTKDTSILEGVGTLVAAGDWIVGIVVLLCSIVLPLGKLAALLVLSTGAARLRERHRALTYHAVECGQRVSPPQLSFRFSRASVSSHAARSVIRSVSRTL